MPKKLILTVIIAPTAAISIRRTSPSMRTAGSAVIVASDSSPRETPRSARSLSFAPRISLSAMT